MAILKFSTFDRELIRAYMQGTQTLEKGIAYVQAINPGASAKDAEEKAIELAQEFCYRKWANDSTGYISSEHIAFREFQDDVDHGRKFQIPKEVLKKQQAEQRKQQAAKEAEQYAKERAEKERLRIEELKAYCAKTNSDFDTVNRMELQRFKKRDNICSFFEAIAFIAAIAAIILWLTGVFTFVVALIAVIACIVLFCIAAGCESGIPYSSFEILKQPPATSSSHSDTKAGSTASVASYSIWTCGNCGTENRSNTSQCKKCGKYKS